MRLFGRSLATLADRMPSVKQEAGTIRIIYSTTSNGQNTQMTYYSYSRGLTEQLLSAIVEVIAVHDPEAARAWEDAYKLLKRKETGESGEAAEVEQ